MDGKLEIMFLPFLGKGHLIPMSEMARAFSGTRGGVKATIVTTPLNVGIIRATIGIGKGDDDDDDESEIEIVSVKFPCAEAGLPEGCENTESIPSPDMVFRFYKATTMMQAPLEHLILQNPPHCLIVSAFFPWASQLAAKFKIPNLVFHGTGAFALCATECVQLYKPHKNVSSDSEPFLIPHLPGDIHMTRMLLPDYAKSGDAESDFSRTLLAVKEAELASLGVIVNSFYELEKDYADYYNVLGRRTWHIGPLSLFNQNQQDKGNRGKQTASSSVVDEADILKWLDSKKPNTVVYVCFGSIANFSETQLREIAKGLEDSKQQFLWVVRRSNREWLPEGFEKRMEGRGMIIWGWAPQVLILEHQAVGAFVTHCGWNSTLEAVSAGVPMITWPVSAEQFYNEKFLTQVLEIGVPVGVTKWARIFGDSITSLQLENAIHTIMAGSVSDAIRNRTHKLSQMARKAVQQNGSSYSQLTHLIQYLRSLPN